MTHASVRSALLAGALLSAGCYSLTSFQSPEVLPARRAVVGGALNLTCAGYSVGDAPGVMPLPELDIAARYGLGGNIDIGTKITGPSPSVSADLKWQFLHRPLFAALDLGGSYGGGGSYLTFFTAYPELILGTKRIYGAARAQRTLTVDSPWRGNADVGGDWLPVFFIGGSFGDKFRVLPELSLRLEHPEFRTTLSPIPGIGVAFQYRLGGD